MMIQSSIITVLLVSTCFQSFSMVQAFDPEDAAGFVQPFSDLTGVASTSGKGALPAGGTEALIGGLLPDIESAVDGSLGKRDEPTESGDESPVGTTHQTSGEGVATYSDGASEDGGLGNLLAQLKKRYGVADPQAELKNQEDSPKTHGKTDVSLLSLRRREGLGLDQLLGADQSAQGGSEGGLTSSLGLRRRSPGLLSGSGSSDSTADAEGGNSVSLIALRRRNTDDKLDDSTETTGGGETKLALLNLGARDFLAAGLREQLERRSTAMLSGSERMDRARQGVVVNSQGDRRAVYARDNGDDRRIIEDYEKLMQEREKEAYGGQQVPYREQEKKGTTKISLASLKKRLVEDVVSSLTDGLGGNSAQGNSDLAGDVTSAV